MSASWSPAECADHYFLRVKKAGASINKKHNNPNFQVVESSGEATASFMTDDEDYDYVGNREEVSSTPTTYDEDVIYSGTSAFNSKVKKPLGSPIADVESIDYYDVDERGSGIPPLLISSTTTPFYSDDEDLIDGSAFNSPIKATTLSLIVEELEYYEDFSGNDYHDEENFQKGSAFHENTTPTSFFSDDDDLVEDDYGSAMKFPKEASDVNLIVDNPHFQDFPSGDNENYIQRRSRKLFLNKEDYGSGQFTDEYYSASYDDDDDDDIEKLLALDEENNNDDTESWSMKTVKVGTNSGEITGLDRCSTYSLEVQAVYKHNVVVNSEDKLFNTLCQNSCDSSNLDYKTLLNEDSNSLTIEIENEPDCLKEYAFKFCLNNNCDEKHFYRSTNSKFTVWGTFNSCLDYEFFLMPKSEIKNAEEINWDKSRYKLMNFASSYAPPLSGKSQVSMEYVSLTWDKPNNCVDGYSVSVYEIRHLPNLLPKYVDKNTEPIIHHIKLSSDESSLIVTNISSCMLHRAEIRSIYKSQKTGTYSQYFQ